MNQKGYDNSESTVGKLLAKRIQIYPDYFFGIILKVIFWGASVRWQIDFLISGRQADLCALDNIVLARTSENLVFGRSFSKKYSMN